MEANFFKHDNYQSIRQKLTGAWPNLRIELHRQSIELWKEGRDEFENNWQFFPKEMPNELLFTLSGSISKVSAERLFAEHYGRQPGNELEASLWANFADAVYSLSPEMTLDECSHPFTLALNKFTYAEFKRRFAEHWPNLSIEIYQDEKTSGNLKELSDDFEMKNLTRVNRLIRNDYYERDGRRDVIEKSANEMILHDRVYLSDLENLLKKVDLIFKIKNQKLGICWNQNSEQKRLLDFQNIVRA